MSRPIPIIHSESRVAKGQRFCITLDEVPCPNCTWTTHLPQPVSLVSKAHLTDRDPHQMQWILTCDTPGMYTLEFLYRRQCCGRPKLKHMTYHIFVF